MTNPEREQFYNGLHPLMREWVAAVEAELAEISGWEGHFVAQENQKADPGYGADYVSPANED